MVEPQVSQRFPHAVQEGLAPGELSRWGGAVGNIEDARVALDTLARAIEDAVYLDEDAYNQVAPVMQYQRAIQVLRVAAYQAVGTAWCLLRLLIEVRNPGHEPSVPTVQCHAALHRQHNGRYKVRCMQQVQS